MPPSRSGSRSGSTASWSWVRLLEGGGLADQPAEPRVCDVEREEKASVAEFGVGDGERAGREPGRQPQAEGADLEEVMRGAEDERAVFHMDRQRHADAAADIFFQAGRAGEALGGMHHLRKAAAPRVKPCPVLAAGG